MDTCTEIVGKGLLVNVNGRILSMDLLPDSYRREL